MNGRGPAMGRRRRQQLLADSGRGMMLLGAITLTHQLSSSAPSSGKAEHLVMSLIIWLFGAALVTLSLVARRFPRLATAGANVAAALRNYLLGGL
jgi:hypothetical protein